MLRKLFLVLLIPLIFGMVQRQVRASSPSSVTPSLRSFFLTPAEQHIQSDLTPVRTRLDAVIDYGQGQGQAWVNGANIATDQPTDTLRILALSSTAVTLEQRLGTSTRRFTLMPRQSYDWLSDRILDPTHTPDAD